VAMRSPIFSNDYCRSTSTGGVRKQRSTAPVVSFLRCCNARDNAPCDHCGDLMNNHCRTRGPAHFCVRKSISLEYLHTDKDESRKWEGDALDVLVARATKPKPPGQEGTVRVSGCTPQVPCRKRRVAVGTGPTITCAGEKRKATLEKQDLYSMGLPKISGPGAKRQSSPIWFVLMLTSRMNGQPSGPAAVEVPVLKVSLSRLLASSRPIPCQGLAPPETGQA
jgi:hypothetical protein